MLSNSPTRYFCLLFLVTCLSSNAIVGNAKRLCLKSAKSLPRKWEVLSDLFYRTAVAGCWNPTNGSLWIVQILSSLLCNGKSWGFWVCCFIETTWTIHSLPWVGFEPLSTTVLVRKDLKVPPTSVGGILYFWGKAIRKRCKQIHATGWRVLES